MICLKINPFVPFSCSLFLLLTINLLGGGNMAMAANTKNWILDDGVMELTPEYNVQHVQGEPYSDVYATFNHLPQKKLVRLRLGDTIAVNGHVLEGINHPNGYYYRARIPVTQGTFTFTLTRGPDSTLSHSFELPDLGIREAPKVYQPYEPLRVSVKYLEPPKYVTDKYNLSIHDPALRFGLHSKTYRKDNPYEFDRLPNIQGGAIVFKHIVKRAPPPGAYPAEISRQQHIVLSEMSKATRSGWIRMSNTLHFTIEVKEPKK